MLKIHEVGSPQETREIFRSFDPENSTWVVSDLRSKLDLTRGLLARHPFLPSEGVLRASELWRLWLKRLRPDLEVASREYVSAVLASLLEAKAMEREWLRAPGASSTAFDYLTQLVPLVSHPNGEEMLGEWFKENPASFACWGRWFELALELWDEFLNVGLIAPVWVSGVLTNEATLHEVWSRPLVVQLGAELDQVEADLLAQLSEHVDVTILKPAPAWAAESKMALTAYEVFDRKVGAEVVRASNAAPAEPKITYRKSTTMIGEIKDAVAQARIWLDRELKGQAPSRVAIVAPDLERYWPALASYLEVEGLPAQKDRVKRLHAFPDVSRWLAVLRLRLGSSRESDLELALFDTAGSEKLISFDRFATLFASIYAREDLGRVEEVAARFKTDLDDINEPLDRDQFVAWSLKQLPTEVNFERVQSLYKRLFADAPERLRLRPAKWFEYLERLSAKIECRVEDGEADGIACLNLSSAESSPATHMIFLGLTESALKPGGRTAISMSDLMSLSAQFGFNLPGPERASLEFEARWVLGDPSRELILSVPETDFAGSALAPSWLWIKGAKAQGVHEDLSLPQTTRWDELQHSHLANIAVARAWPSDHSERLEEAFLENLGELTPSAWTDPESVNWISTLSPSGIEDYLDCPFLFAAKRLFSLSDNAELDLEVDPSRRGSLMHKLFELLTEEPVRFDYTDEELGAVVEKARHASKLELADIRLWDALKAKHIDLGRRFLAFEREHRLVYPQTRTIGREVEVAGFLNLETGEISAERKSPIDWAFRGRIDRVDEDAAGNVVIYDYKSSNSTAKQFGSWIKNNQVQLLMYSLAVEKGLTKLGVRRVIGALYYVSRPFDRDQGFKVSDVEQGLYETEKTRKKNRLTEDEKQQLFAQAQELTLQAARGIRLNQFAPSPRHQDLCGDCRWSALCRAPHLL